MYGHDEMVDVLVESYSNDIKRTMGGCSFDGNMKIIDQYGSNNSQGMGTYMCWILFGDPTLTLRNATPANMNVTHASSMSTSATSFTVNATNGNGALATLTRNNEIMGSATINNGSCNITFAAPGATGTATLTVFGYNKITYIATIQITGGGTQTYNINVSANPSQGGNVTGGGTYNQGQQCTVTATANDGYTFTNWTENGNVVSTNRNYTFTVNGNRTLVANFTQQNYTINVSANPTLGGTVTGGGAFHYGDNCTVIATANNGYTFTNWTEGGNVVSTNASYSFSVTGNRTLVANFTALSYTITATADPIEGGTVSGGGTFNYNQSCTLTATPAANYTFVNWTKNGLPVSTNATYTFTVTGSATYVAHFQLDSFTISVSANPTEGGMLTGNGTYNYGENCTVVATANEGYDFINWTENDNVVSTDANYSFTVTNNRVLVANFEAQTFDVKVSIDPAEAATVIGEGSYSYGSEVTLTLARNEDYLFVNWTEDGVVLSEEMIYVFTITRNRNLVANFIYTEGVGEHQAEIDVYPNPTQGEVTLKGEGINHIRIFNLYGQTVYNDKAEGNQVRIDLSNLASGIYMMHIDTENGQVVKQIVVE